MGPALSTAARWVARQTPKTVKFFGNRITILMDSGFPTIVRREMWGSLSRRLPTIGRALGEVVRTMKPHLPL